MKRRLFLAAGALAYLTPSRIVARPYTSEPDVSKNYELNQVETLHKSPPAKRELNQYYVKSHYKGPPHAKVAASCKPCEGFESVFIEEETLRTSDDRSIRKWRDHVLKLADEPEIKQLSGVNDIVNRRVRYISDYKHWGVKDRWGFPVEALEEGGDCEDFAILKMESLKFLGWSEDRMLVLVGVSDVNRTKQAHAVLLAELEDGSQLILDNLSNFMRPPHDEHHFFPMYGVNPSGYFHIEA